MTKTILVTGGAGYIGSFVVNELLSRNYKVVIIDNLSTGNIKNTTGVDFYQADFANKQCLAKIFATYNNIDTVIHLAASTEVLESCHNPGKYFYNNAYNTLKLLTILKKHQIKNFVFSSTAAVYGKVANSLVTENTSTKPINPYGLSKLLAEQFISNFAKNNNINFAILRYFNVAGAMPDGSLGSYKKNPTNLIDVAVMVARQQKPYLPIFGNDYNTKDGSAIRDYIHVMDLAKVHVLSLDYLQKNNNLIANVGYGSGSSVFEVINIIEATTLEKLAVKIEDRRQGDPEIVVADNSYIKEKLAWQPSYNDLNIIVKSALKWAETKLL